MTALLVGRMCISPAQILIDGSGEEHVVLQYDRDLVAEGVKIVGTDVFSADENTAFGHIVEAADEVDERGLGTSGSANDTDRLAGFYGEVNIGEHRLCGCLAVTEGHMVKGDASVRHGFIRIFRIGDVALLI